MAAPKRQGAKGADKGPVKRKTAGARVASTPSMAIAWSGSWERDNLAIGPEDGRGNGVVAHCLGGGLGREKGVADDDGMVLHPHQPGKGKGGLVTKALKRWSIPARCEREHFFRSCELFSRQDKWAASSRVAGGDMKPLGCASVSDWD